MSTVRGVVLLVFALLPATGQAAPSVTVENLRLWKAPDQLQLVFDVNRVPEYRVFTLKDPPRVVIDMDNARLDGALPPVQAQHKPLQAIRSARNAKDRLRVVLDLAQALQARSYHLKPYGPYGHRLVIDLYDEQRPERFVPDPPPQVSDREVVIAIDAGHGGEDPGAIGRRYRTREKDVVLAIARELQKQINKTAGMRAVMIRDGDYFIGLKERYKIARRERATLFISIHADAVPGRGARGSSVYALSERGATDSVSQFLADSENASDQLGGVNLDDKDDQVKRVLVDLSYTPTISASLTLGRDVLAELRKVGPLHMGKVGQAGFAVLKSPDTPSILVETAFISNPTGEKKLRSKSFQRKTARGILKGIKRFVRREDFKPYQKVDTASARHAATSASRLHTVRRGETLIGIASRYGIQVDALRLANNIKGNRLLAGSKLRIP